jgi:hypothetical protein
MVYQIKHETWRGEIGNCIAAPGFELKVGMADAIRKIHCIKMERLGGIDLFTVYWGIVMPGEKVSGRIKS